VGGNVGVGVAAGADVVVVVVPGVGRSVHANATSAASGIPIIRFTFPV
jgi:hypothetical protein